MLPIDALWETHQHSTFPAAYATEEVEDLNLALLDAATSACIQAYREIGTLDLRRAATLGLCLRHLNAVLRKLEPGAAHDYFDRLEILAHEVLRQVRDDAPEVEIG